MLTPNEFTELVKELDISDLAKIPITLIPPDLDVKTLEQFPQSTRQVIENLLFEANVNDLSTKISLQNKYGNEFIETINYALQLPLKGSWIILEQKLHDLISISKPILAKQEGGSSLGGTIKSLIKRCNDLIIDIRIEQVTLKNAENSISNVSIEDQSLPIISASKTKIKKQSILIENHLAQFFAYRLKLYLVEMSYFYKLVDRSAETRSTLKKEIETYTDNQKKEKWSIFQKIFKKNKYKEKQYENQKKIQTMVNEYKVYAVEISENDLMSWLDAIVDISLFYRQEEADKQLLPKSRALLFSLLQFYCESQETGAKQIATNPFLIIDAESAVNYLIKSEEFILKYFAMKKGQSSAWMSKLAEGRIDELNLLEKELLQELKKTRS